MKRSFTLHHPALIFIALPSRLKSFLLLAFGFCMQAVLFAQSCPNVDFAAGNFGNWAGRTGTYNTPGVFNLGTPGIITPAYHNIMNTPGTDPNTGGMLQYIPAGYNFSARINSQGNINGRASQLSYTLTVDPTNALFIYNYAVVLNDGGHSADQQPKFEIQVKDQFGNIIPCTIYEVAAGNGIPGFITFGQVRWKDWTKVGVDLTSYMGQTVTIEARVAGCVQEQGAHFGYAYIVGECQPLEIDLQFCAGDPVANLSAPDGFAAYQWSTGQTTQNITVPSPAVGQVLTCTVTSVTGCQAVLQVTLNPTIVTATIPTTTDVSCAGGNNGSATVVASGGAPGYTYAWTPSGGTGATGTGLGDGNYTVTVTESGGCTATATTVINEPAPLTITGTPTQVNCFGGATGAIDITPSGGTSGYTYLWSNGATTQDITGLAAGGYTVTVTDANNCTSSYSVNITQPAAALSITGVPTNVLCFGGNTGAIDITPAGGTPTYTYLWSNGATTQDINTLPAGPYSVTVTDANGCTNSLYSANITQPAAALSVTGTPTDVLCFGGNNGSIDITPAGGTPGYTYLWSNGATTQDINTLIAGGYSVTVTDANGCTNSSFSANINQPATSVSVTSTTVNVGCFGGATGSADITPAGGTPGYTYLWSNGATSQDISGVAAGGYTVTVTDANNCTVSSTINITQPAATLTLAGVPTHVLCFGNSTGAVNLTPSGGTPSYNFSWSNGQTTEDISGLAAGNYSVTVTDANSCTNSFSINITQPAGPLTLTNTATDVLCFGGNNGSIDLTPAGGTPGYSYLWSNGATTQDINTLISGAYSVTVTDANGCTNTLSDNIAQPAAALSITGTSVNVGCFGAATGSVDITPAGGTPGYTYLWSSGQTSQDISGVVSGGYSVTVTDANSCTSSFSVNITQPAAPLTLTGVPTHVLCFGNNTGAIDLTPAGGTVSYSFNWSSGQTTEDISGLPAGAYSVTVTDANSCTSSYSVNITQPAAALSVTGITTNVNCFGGNNGTIDITPAGGTPGYTYLWSNGATTQDINTLPAGGYSVTITDANGCTNSTYAANITQPAAALTLTGTSVNVSCFGGATGSVDITPAGGTPAYTYLWSNGATTQDIAGLVSGNYNVTVTDANGCTNNSFSVTVTQPAAALAVTGTWVDVLCFGNTTGSIDITPTGGTPGYTYSWTNGQTTQDAVALAAGSYTVTVTDANGCTNNSYTATIAQPAAALSVTGLVNNVSCYSGSNGTIDITPAGGTPGYTFVWSNGQTSEDLSGLSAGSYAVLITDANGCTNTSYIGNVSQPLAALGVSGEASNVSCNGFNDGFINITVVGGTGPYTYVWNTGASSEDINVLGTGNYSVSVTDDKGCFAHDQWIIGEPPPLVVTSQVFPNTCYGVADASISLNVTGGVPQYHISWNNGASGDQLNGLNPGNYTVTITDAHNCLYTQNYNIVPAPPLTVNADSLFEIFVGEQVTIHSVGSGGTGALTYQWSPGQDLNCTDCQDPVANPLVDMEYTVTVTDANGCTATDVTIIELQYNLFVPNTFTPNGDGDNDSFTAYSVSCKEYTMRIFNRWGEEIYVTNDIHAGWDGTFHNSEAKQDVYVYRIEAKFYNGKSQELIGQVNLLR